MIEQLLKSLGFDATKAKADFDNFAKMVVETKQQLDRIEAQNKAILARLPLPKEAAE